MEIAISKYLLFVILLAASHAVRCQIRIDHAIVVVSDLEDAKKEYSDLGFHIKEGRLHKNGLLNAHIKFANQSSLELMTVIDTPEDAIAREYQKLLAEAQGGVYLALTGHHHDSLKVLLTGLGIAFIETNGKLWSYLSFPSDSYLAHLFFIDYHIDPTSLDDSTDHSNQLNRIRSVALEGGEALYRFLEKMGLNVNVATSTFQTETGEIILIAPSQEEKRPRLVSITFAGEDIPGLEINWRM